MRAVRTTVKRLELAYGPRKRDWLDAQLQQNELAGRVEQKNWRKGARRFR